MEGGTGSEGRDLNARERKEGGGRENKLFSCREAFLVFFSDTS